MTAPQPGGNYQVATRWGDLIFVAGMTPRVGKELVATGRVGDQVDLPTAARCCRVAAERAVLALRTIVEAELVRPLSLTVYVNAVDDSVPLSAVADGASDYLNEVFGSTPARSAVGVATLPGGAPVEISLIFGVD